MTTYLYQIPIPKADNNGKPYGSRAVSRFLKAVAGVAGGYTYLPGTCQGAWCDPKSGKIYYDRVGLLQFALDLDKVPACSLDAIVDAFSVAFPDQLCAMMAVIGTVTFYSLPLHAKENAQ